MATLPDNQRDAPIEVLAYDASWPQQFQAECLLLYTALVPWLMGPIEHIGSTAVPMLAAKPIIDIMAPVQTLQASVPAIEAACSVGYVYYPYQAQVQHWFCKPSSSYRTHHLHLVPWRSTLWLERLAFRDALRRQPALAAEYAALKRGLAVQFRQDREAYTQAKSEFVRRVCDSN